MSVDESVEARTREPAADEIDDLHWTEPPTQDRRAPDSSQRTRAAASLDEVLAEVTAESEIVTPLKTPPPESGRQPMDGGYGAPIPEPSRSDLLAMPTAEQLGETLELEAPTAAALELDLVVSQVQKAKQDLEFELPPRQSVLEPPARTEMPTLTREASAPASQHRAPEQSQILNVSDDSDTIEMAAIAAPNEAAEPSTDRDNLILSPELTMRPAQPQAVIPEFIYAARRFAPKSFAELLDASLKLGG